MSWKSCSLQAASNSTVIRTAVLTAALPHSYWMQHSPLTAAKRVQRDASSPGRLPQKDAMRASLYTRGRPAGHTRQNLSGFFCNIGQWLPQQQALAHSHHSNSTNASWECFAAVHHCFLSAIHVSKQLCVCRLSADVPSLAVPYLFCISSLSVEWSAAVPVCQFISLPVCQQVSCLSSQLQSVDPTVNHLSCLMTSPPHLHHPPHLHQSRPHPGASCSHMTQPEGKRNT